MTVTIKMALPFPAVSIYPCITATENNQPFRADVSTSGYPSAYFLATKVLSVFLYEIQIPRNPTIDRTLQNLLSFTFLLHF